MDRTNYLQPLPVWLRWVMAVVLAFNAVVAPIGTTQAMGNQDSAAMPGMFHCHHHSPLQSSHSKAGKYSPNSCPCCGNGTQCQCGCISLAALPAIAGDHRVLVLPTPVANTFMPQSVGRVTGRLLRPPIA